MLEGQDRFDSLVQTVASVGNVSSTFVNTTAALRAALERITKRETRVAVCEQVIVLATIDEAMSVRDSAAAMDELCTEYAPLLAVRRVSVKVAVGSDIADADFDDMGSSDALAVAVKRVQTRTEMEQLRFGLSADGLGSLLGELRVGQRAELFQCGFARDAVGAGEGFVDDLFVGPSLCAACRTVVLVRARHKPRTMRCDDAHYDVELVTQQPGGDALAEHVSMREYALKHVSDAALSLLSRFRLAVHGADSSLIADYVPALEALVDCLLNICALDKRTVVEFRRVLSHIHTFANLPIDDNWFDHLSQVS